MENYALTVNFAIMVSIVKFIGFSFLSLSLTIAACCCSVNKDVKDADVFKLEGTTDTLLFKQAPFQWRVTPRYDYSKVYVTFLNLDKDKLKEAVEVLNNAAGFFRSLVGKRMKLRVVPYITFVYDDTLVKGMELSELITRSVRHDQELQEQTENNS